MKVIFMGTPEFAVKPFESLIASKNHEVVAVVSQPDRPVGRRAVVAPTPVKAVALKHSIPVLQFEKIRDGGAEKLGEFNADIIVTCAYGQILSQDIIDLCPFGVVNVHASLLPKLRGAAPIQYAVIGGEKKTGVTFMQTDIGLDDGDIIKSFELDIGETETSGELAQRLSLLGAEKLDEILDSLFLGTAERIKQDDALATVVKTIKKSDTIVDFNKDCESVKNFINGLSPTPAAKSEINGFGVKFFRAAKIEGYDGECGEVVAADKKLVVACLKGAVEILELQADGGKRMSARDFLNGRKIKVGDVFKTEKC